MAKLKVSIINDYTLKLEEDGKKGDLIDLKEINQVNDEYIKESIKLNAFKFYEDKFNRDLELEKIKLNQEHNKKINELNSNNEELKRKITDISNNNKFEIEKLKQNYDLKIQDLTNTIEKERETTELKLKNEYNSKIQDLENTIKNLKENNELTKKIEIQELSNNYQNEINKLNSEISKLTNERKSLTIKRLGENLEKWCNNEFLNNGLSTMNNIFWQKDNTIIENTKADYIFKVYLNDSKNENEVLVSAILEMKSEEKDSTNKNKNSYFYNKLDKDRQKKNLEYAILVSELEWDTDNDAPIKKVSEYEKMYVVRPQYFISLLNILYSFGMKYSEIMYENIKEKLELKDTLLIIEEFEDMKKNILDNSIKNIQSNLQEIIKQSEIINKANSKLLDSANIIIERHLETLINKIKDFNINRIVKKIDRL